MKGLGLVSFVVDRASLYSGKSSSRIVFGFSFAHRVLGGVDAVVVIGSGAGESTKLASRRALPSSLSSAPIPSPVATPSFLRNLGGGRRESFCAPSRILPPSLCTLPSACAALPAEPSPFCDKSTRRLFGGFDWPSVLLHCSRAAARNRRAAHVGDRHCECRGRVSSISFAQLADGDCDSTGHRAWCVESSRVESSRRRL